MNFEAKLHGFSQDSIWQEYCGFLDLSMKEYMDIQYRLLQEQIELLSKCGLGQRLFHGKIPKTVKEFRENVPLTTYDDYADVLLMKREDMLPAPPVTWLSTTWEGGTYPAKLAPYTESMLSVYKNNILAALLLSTSTTRGRFHVRGGERVLYGLAPLPYPTGLFPALIDSELKLKFLPPLKEAQKMSFSQQSKRGFQMGLESGMDLFFGMSSIIYKISKNLGTDKRRNGGGLHRLFHMSPIRMVKLLTAFYRSKRDGVDIKPCDLFSLKGFVCVGTDSALYKDELEQLWGCRPLEIAGGTEPSCMGTETWSKDGLVFYPDACFYEFIPECEMLRSIDVPNYVPKTYLMDELVANEKYELVITVLKGGAFVRYRIGDVYRCIRKKNKEDRLDIPQFEYVDRIPTVIDIAGFTRITEHEISQVIELSRLDVEDWFALKEYDDSNSSYLHMYVEMSENAVQSGAVTKQILREHLSIYFRHFDSDYNDLKKLLGVEPLKVTILCTGTFEHYQKTFGKKINRVNASWQDVADLLGLHRRSEVGEEDFLCR